MTTVEVVPLVRLPRSVNQIYSYSWHVFLAPGQLVIVEWHHQKVLGVVVSRPSKKARPTKLKSLLGISPLGALTQSQITLAEVLQTSFAASATLAYLTVVGRLPLEAKPVDVEGSEQLSRPSKRPTGQFGKPGINHFIGWPSPADPGWKKILNSLRLSGQVLCLFPDKYRLNQAAANWRHELSVEVWGETALHNKAAQWVRIRSGASDIILGNRSAIFAPYKTLKTVIFFDANDENYRAVDEQPHYDARELASKIDPSVSCNFVEWGPSIIGQRDRFYLKQANNTRLDINFRDDLPPALKSSTVTPQLEAGLRQATGWSLCLINKLGKGVVICRDCQLIIACPQCHKYLIDHGQVLVCSWCSLRVSKPELCTNCGGSRLTAIGIGLNSLVAALHKIFPERVILSAEAKLTQEKTKLNDLFAEIQKNSQTIVVATKAILPYLENQVKPEFIALIQPESWLSHSGWNINSQLWDLLRRASALTTQQVLVDTNYIDRKAVKLILQRDLRGWLAQEKKFRHQFGYPPFSRLVVVTGKLKPEIFQSTTKTIQLMSCTKDRAILKVTAEADLQPLVKNFLGDWKIDINPPNMG